MSVLMNIPDALRNEFSEASAAQSVIKRSGHKVDGITVLCYEEGELRDIRALN